jgi:Fe-S oxidoreductase
VACAEDKLMPALRKADPDALILADGFSCRTQIRELSDDRRPIHLAQAIAAALEHD